MEKNKKIKIYITAIFLSFLLATLIVTISVVVSQKKQNPVPWVLQSYGNNVALFNGEEIIEVYGTIMLDTLPAEDKRQLDNGIYFSTREEAVNAIEDYDG